MGFGTIQWADLMMMCGMSSLRRWHSQRCGVVMPMHLFLLLPGAKGTLRW